MLLQPRRKAGRAFPQILDRRQSFLVDFNLGFSKSTPIGFVTESGMEWEVRYLHRGSQHHFLGSVPISSPMASQAKGVADEISWGKG
jgi:hypothetical protein